MASLELRSNCYRIVFRFAGKKFQHALKTANEREAEGCLARLEENLRLLERGRLVVPPDADLPTFLVSDGRLGAPPELPISVLTLKDLSTRYAEIHSNGALEANSLYTVEIHLRHFRRSLGDRFSIARLKQVDVEPTVYVDVVWRMP